MNKPLKCRQLQAQMKLKELSLGTVAKRAGMDITTASLLLNGRLISPLKFDRIRAVIERAKTPPDPIHA